MSSSTSCPGVIGPSFSIQCRVVACGPPATDALVADVVALGAGAPPERALDPALAVASATLSHSRTESSKPRIVQSIASCSCSTSHASLTSRISERYIASSGRPAPSPCARQRARRRRGRRRAQHPRLAERTQHVGKLVEVPAGDAEELRRLGQRAAPTRPGLAVAAVAPEGVVAPGVARAEVERRVAVVDDEHGVRRLVAGQVDVRGLGAEAVVGVVGPRLQGAGRVRRSARRRTARPAGAPAGSAQAATPEALDRVVLVRPSGAHELHEGVAGRDRVGGGRKRSDT